MEKSVHKEIRSYREQVFFGLSTRQFLCSACAVCVAVGSYLGLRDLLGKEMVSWFCLLSAVPFALAGFFNYQGMTFEKFVLAWFKSQILCAGRRVYRSINYYDPAHKPKERRRRRYKYVSIFKAAHK